MSLPQFPKAWPPFYQHRKPDVLGVARGSAESDLCTHAAFPDHGPKGLAPDAHWGLTYRRSSHTQPLQHNSATGSATPWPPNVRRSSSSFQSLKPHIMSSSHCHFPYIVVVSDPSQVLLQLPVTETSHHVLITLPLPIHRGGK
ncbi:hypothetical protein J6590_041592 [Homalodisca vitripennis]|nr:hypothetical protein J6590_041592 [Homalodisca vitripennis]